MHETWIISHVLIHMREFSCSFQKVRFFIWDFFFAFRMMIIFIKDLLFKKSLLELKNITPNPSTWISLLFVQTYRISPHIIYSTLFSTHIFNHISYSAKSTAQEKNIAENLEMVFRYISVSRNLQNRNQLHIFYKH